MKNPFSCPAPLLALPVMALALAGCAHKDTIVGKWKATITQPGGAVNTTLDFTPDGKETITGQGGSGGMTMTITANGTYTVSGSNLTQNLTTMTMGTRTMPIPPHPAQPGPFTLDGDHLTLTNPSSNQSLTLTRVKE